MKWSYAVQNLRSGVSSSNLDAMAFTSITNVVTRACIARAITLSKRGGAIQSYRWIAWIGAGDQNVA
jgi:hypothetical protein